MVKASNLLLLALVVIGCVDVQAGNDCTGEEWATNCSDPDHREFCDFDSSILKESFPRSVCAPVGMLEYLVGEKDYCGRCKPPEDIVFGIAFPSQAPSTWESSQASEYSAPSGEPSTLPSDIPSSKPSGSSLPSLEPSGVPSSLPSGKPSGSSLPSAAPSSFPSAVPSSKPSGSSLPSLEPSGVPSSLPSGKPSGSSLPSALPSSYPSAAPSSEPSAVPSSVPSGKPSGSSLPSGEPSDTPSVEGSSVGETYSPAMNIDIAGWLRNLPSASPSAQESDSNTDNDLLESASFTFPYAFVDGELTGEQLKDFESAIQVFLNLEWSRYDSRGTLIVDVHAVPKDLNETTRLRRRTQSISTANPLDLKISAVVPRRVDQPYDLLGIIATIFDERKLSLRYSLEIIGIPIVLTVSDEN